MSLLNKSILKHAVTDALFASLLLFSGAQQAHAAAILPTNGQVVAGSGTASISTSGNTETINQSTNKAIINWKTFDIGAGDTVNFIQPSTTSVTLNRVTGSTAASTISGTLKATGIVFLVNTNGVLFTKGASVNVGGLIATTSDIKNSDFNAGIYNFAPTSGKINTDAAVINDGTITVNQDKGLVALVGHDVENNGIIQAKVSNTKDATGATIALGAGDQFSIDLNGDGLINLAVTDPKVTNLLAQNAGTITANGGTVAITAAAAENTVNSLVNMTGIIQADNVKTANGKVLLTATGANSETKVSGSISANNGSVTVSGQKTTVTGKASITAQNGFITLKGAKTAINDGAVIDATAGFVQTTGSKTLQVDNNVTVDASIWYIDSASILIANASKDSFVSASTIGAALNNGADITATASGTDGSITVADSITKFKGGNASVSLFANGDIVFNSGATLVSGSGKLDVLLTADNDLTNGGAVVMNKASAILSNGGDVTVTGNGDATYQTGITVNGALIDAGGGDVSLTGTGAAVAGGNNYGVALEGGSLLTTDAKGTMYVFGIAGTGAKAENYGVYLDGTSVTTNKGYISIEGSADATGTGIVAAGNELLKSGSAPVNQIGDSTTSGDIEFITDALTAGQSLGATTKGNVTFDTYGTTASIGVAGAAGTLQITRDVLRNVDASSITIGNLADTGGITVNRFNWSNLATIPNVSLLNSGDITVNGRQTMGAGSFFAETTKGDITLGAHGSIRSTASGVAVTLVASNGNFINNNTSASALSVNSGSQWIVYSTSPAGDVLGNLAPDFEQFDASYPSKLAQATGNGLLFSTSLSLTADLDGTIEKTYDGTKTASLSSSDFTVDSGYSATISSTGGLYDSANVGSGIGVTASGLTLGDVTTTGGAKVYGATLSNTTATGNVGKIDAADLTITATDVNSIYGQDPTLSLFKTKGLVNGETIDSVTLTTDATLSGSGHYNAGNWSIDASSPVAGSTSAFVASNYNITFVSGKLDVSQASLNITADAKSKVYGAADPTLTYGETGLVSGDAILGGLSRDAGEHVANGPYAITQGTLDAGSNYAITYTGAALTITPAPLTITADNQHFTYGGTLPTLTASFDGFVNGDTTASLTTGPSLNTTATSSSHVANGPYAITASGAVDSDYTITYKAGSLTIDPAALTITADNKTMTFGDALPALTYTFSPLANGDTSSIFTGALATTANAASVIGNYSITQGTLAATSDYAVTFNSGTLNIGAPATLFSLFQKINPPVVRSRGPNGVLLAMASGTGSLGGLAPQAGGQPPIDFSKLTPDQLANLKPAAGGNSNIPGGIVSLIECNAATPCEISQ